MIRILIADDHALVREGLKKIVEGDAQMKMVGEARNGEEMLRLVRKTPCDLAVMDISMPGRNGLDLLRALKAERPNLPLLVLTVHPEDQYAVRVLKMGAAGYLTKESAPAELIRAIRKIAGGGRYVSESLAERLACDLGADTGRPPHERLSDREYQVVRLMASGKAMKEIAGELSLSIKTVSMYRGRALSKLGLKNNAELIRYAVEQRLVD